MYLHVTLTVLLHYSRVVIYVNYVLNFTNDKHMKVIMTASARFFYHSQNRFTLYTDSEPAARDSTVLDSLGWSRSCPCLHDERCKSLLVISVVCLAEAGAFRGAILGNLGVTIGRDVAVCRGAAESARTRPDDQVEPFT